MAQEICTLTLYFLALPQFPFAEYLILDTLSHCCFWVSSCSLSHSSCSCKLSIVITWFMSQVMWFRLWNFLCLIWLSKFLISEFPKVKGLPESPLYSSSQATGVLPWEPDWGLEPVPWGDHFPHPTWLLWTAENCPVLFTGLHLGASVYLFLLPVPWALTCSGDKFWHMTTPWATTETATITWVTIFLSRLNLCYRPLRQ